MITVVVPLFNKEKSIKNTINSILNQSYEDFELIVVDDGSTDNSLNIVRSIKDPRIKILTKRNGGVSSARNAGIKKAGSNYIAFIDGDDVWLPWHLETIHRMINEFVDPTVGGYCTRIVKSKHVEENSTNENKIEQGILIENYVKLASGTNSVLSSSSFAVKKSCLEEVGLYDEELTYGEDVELWYRLFRKYKLILSNNVTAIYRTESENRSDAKIIPLNKRFHHFDFSNKVIDEKRYLGKLVCLLILDYLMQGAYKISFAIFWKYKKHSFFILRYFFSLVYKRLAIRQATSYNLVNVGKK